MNMKHTPKKLLDEILNGHIGAGIIYIKTAEDTVSSVEFCTCRNGGMYRIDGTPVFPLELGRGDEAFTILPAQAQTPAKAE